MIVGKDFWLTTNDIDACVLSGAVSLVNISSVDTTIEDAIVTSGIAQSKGFLRKNSNAVKLFVFKDEMMSNFKIFRKTNFVFGKFDISQCSSVLAIIGNKFAIINFKRS